LVNGANIALFSLVAAAVAIPGKSLSPLTAILAGGVSSLCAVAMLTFSAAEHSLVLFSLALMFGGTAYSLLFSGGLTLLNANAPAHHRGGTLSALFLVAYLGQGVAALALGKIATLWSLSLAVDAGSVLVGLLSACAMLLALFYATPKSTPRPIIGERL
jgi:MFS family permease